ncbi:MAG: hypothetical protein AAFV38_08965 [Pseudomonadota bacterium]
MAKSTANIVVVDYKTDQGVWIFVNRFGLVGLWLVFTVAWHHIDDRKPFIEYFLILAALGSVIGGLSGYCSYNTFKPDHHESHSGAAVLVWASGVLLVYVVAYIATIIFQAADCYHKVTVEQIEQLVLNPGCSSDKVAKIYAALQPMQTGIGAAIGLLGLAWSTMYKSVYEDWRKSEPRSFQQ